MQYYLSELIFQSRCASKNRMNSQVPLSFGAVGPSSSLGRQYPNIYTLQQKIKFRYNYIAIVIKFCSYILLLLSNFITTWGNIIGHLTLLEVWYLIKLFDEHNIYKTLVIGTGFCRNQLEKRSTYECICYYICIYCIYYILVIVQRTFYQNLENFSFRTNYRNPTNQNREEKSHHFKDTNQSSENGKRHLRIIYICEYGTLIVLCL